MNETLQLKIEKRLRLASGLVIVGLGLQLLTFLSNHPLAFLAFIFIGSPLVLAGTVLYLLSLIAHE